MSLTIAIAKETANQEHRVAASPDTVKKLAGAGLTIQIESGAGEAADVTDNMYKDAGAQIVKSKDDAYKNADIVLAVQVNEGDLLLLKKDAVYIGHANPYQNEALIKAAAGKNITLFSMELVPRITRAQAMDVLSSQANLAGYKAVLDATEHYARAMPMMMTAAGTVAPAKVFVMGAGVAGLQAIATAKRLGAVVSATDVRPAAKEQVQSLGGSFVAVEDEEFKEAETAGGYAKEMSKEYQKKQAALVEEHIAKQDIVITTALIPGRPAPKLISEKMVKSMKPGSVIVDMAAPTGGNCELTEFDKVVQTNGVTIIGHANIPSRLAASSSSLYAKNLLNLLNLIIKDGALTIEWDDDIIKGIALTKDGKIIHPNFGGKAQAEPKKQDASEPIKGKASEDGDKLVEQEESEKKTGTKKD